MNISHRSQGLLYAALAGFTWSLLAIAIKIVVQTVPSGTIVWFRFAVALLGLLVLVIKYDRSQLRAFRKWPPLAVLAGVVLAINFYGYQKGVELTTPSNAQVLIQGAPISLVFCGIFFFREKLNMTQWFGLLLAFVGLALFLNDQLQSSIAHHETFVHGNIWLLVASVTWAGYASLQKVLTKKGWKPQEINLILYFVAFVCLFPTAEIEDLHGLTGTTWILLIYLGLNTLIAYGAMGMALKLAPASQVSMIITCNPLLTLLFMEILSMYQVSWIQPDEVSTIGYVGALCVISGILLTISRPSGQSR